MDGVWPHSAVTTGNVENTSLTRVSLALWRSSSRSNISEASRLTVLLEAIKRNRASDCGKYETTVGTNSAETLNRRIAAGRNTHWFLLLRCQRLAPLRFRYLARRASNHFSLGNVTARWMRVTVWERIEGARRGKKNEWEEKREILSVLS